MNIASVGIEVVWTSANINSVIIRVIENVLLNTLKPSSLKKLEFLYLYIEVQWLKKWLQNFTIRLLLWKEFKGVNSEEKFIVFFGIVNLTWSNPSKTFFWRLNLPVFTKNLGRLISSVIEAMLLDVFRARIGVGCNYREWSICPIRSLLSLWIDVMRLQEFVLKIWALMEQLRTKFENQSEVHF